MSGKPDPKPVPAKRKPVRKVDPKAAAVAKRRAFGDAHHVVPKGSPHFGDDVVDNLIVLPHALHMAEHDGKHDAKREIGRRLARRHVLYALDKKGLIAGADWLMRRYLLTEDEIVTKLRASGPRATQVSVGSGT